MKGICIICGNELCQHEFQHSKFDEESCEICGENGSYHGYCKFEERIFHPTCYVKEMNMEKFLEFDWFFFPDVLYGIRYALSSIRDLYNFAANQLNELPPL